ncbi:MAG: helix-turn-helix transcriptional regulator [Anaerovoracaceae bacterium]|nr:helix-turn-helix transcriptional regulator [Anaerovoracaceae bacterium]
MLGQRIRSLRVKNHYTQQNMADSLNMSLRSYQRYEGGQCDPPLTTLVAIADIFNTSTDYLLGRDEWLKSHGVSVDVSL